MYTKEQMAATIDHAVLSPDCTSTELSRHAEMCRRYGVYSMCVRPCDVRRAVRLLKSSPVKVSCVLSFPHGADTSGVKVFQTERAISDGVEEIDMVMNIGRFLSGDYRYVCDDIKGVVSFAHSFDVLVKVILESGYLNLEQVAKACEISQEAGADFVKTSTGFGPGGATLEVTRVMIDAVGGKMKIKASGGIRTWEAAVAFLNQGVDRLGISSTKVVLSGAPRR